MLVRVKRFFISSVFGNVDEGRVLDVSDSKGRQLIGAGLAVEHGKTTATEQKQSSFQSPVEAGQAGASLPAGQALQKETVSVSAPGAKKVTYRKPKGKLPS